MGVLVACASLNDLWNVEIIGGRRKESRNRRCFRIVDPAQRFSTGSLLSITCFFLITGGFFRWGERERGMDDVHDVGVFSFAPKTCALVRYR